MLGYARERFEDDIEKTSKVNAFTFTTCVQINLV